MRLRFLPFLLLVISFVRLPAHAESDPKSILAVRTSIPPIVDGLMSEPAWSVAVPSSDFLQQLPIEGAPPTERTEIRILYDEAALYIFCTMFDSSPDSIVSRLSRRDDEPRADYISIRIDSYHDQQTCFEFTINASGSKTDVLEYDDGMYDDDSWDPVWDVATRVTSEGWNAEVRIPLQSLRYNPENSTWGIDFIRTICRKNEHDYWALIRSSDNGLVSHFGHLTGLTGLPSPAHVEVLPYGVASGEFFPAADATVRHRDFVPKAGFDLKYGLSSNFTVDMTVNPDFGQVEADPEVLNLSTFETFYPEKRPFFIEGTQILHFTTFGGDAGPGLFYSRRIGRAIEVDPPDGSVVTEEPHAATILGAAKITGKTDGGLSVGILEAMTQREYYAYRDSTGISHTDRAEPYTNYGLVRMRQDVWGSSNVGAIVTAVARESRFPVFTGGTDWNLKFDDATYVVNGFLAGSIANDPADSLRITGTAGKLQLAKAAGLHWLYNLSYDFTTPRYYINDIGYFRRPNDNGVIGQLKYQEMHPGDILRSYELSYQHHLRWNFKQVPLIRQGQTELDVLFLNYYDVSLGGSYSLPAYDDRESRGHGLYHIPLRYDAHFDGGSDSRKAVEVRADGEYVYDEAGQRTCSLGTSLNIKPTSAIEFEIGGEYQQIRNFEGWVANYTPAAGYVPWNSAVPWELSIFAHRDVDNHSLTLRGSMTFSQRLSLQLYSQLFFAKGEYHGFSYLDSSSSLIRYDYPENNDFNSTALRTNIVLRWEYLTGSTLFLVWSHGRDFGETGGFHRSYIDEIDRTFRTPPDNVFLLKVSYWYSI